MSITLSLAMETGLRPEVVEKIMRTAPVRYKEYQIPKRSGGMRDIAQPAREVKVLQHALMGILLSKLPVHEAAMAYRTGTSIRDNAAKHAGSGPILKMDFASFFPSIRASDWEKYCRTSGCLKDDEDIHLTSLLLFKRTKGSQILRLAIGAPSSPMLSNAILFEFDERICALVAKDETTYTRYADDLTFSARRTGFLTGVQRAVSTVLKELDFPRLEINASKTNYATRRYSRNVTGLTLANDGRVTIGKHQKRLINAAVYNFKQGFLDEIEVKKLSGYLAHINSVEPDFLSVLRRRYSDETVVQIQKSVQIPAKGSFTPWFSNIDSR